MLTIRAMSNGQGYSARHLEHSDYYAEGHRVAGQWHGRGAELLGLEGEVQSPQFEAVREGLDPATGEFLRQRQSADRLASDGTTQSRGRNLYDFTLSAPKSVSIMATVGGDDRLIGAHQTAVSEALRELEVHAGTRVRLNGANEDRATGNLVLAVYHHDASRELDPQLHSHAVAANLTYDGVEGRWKALQASGIYEHRAFLTEVYRNALAREVLSLGYTIEDRHDTRGRDLGFEIRGVSSEIIERYSQRSQQRDLAVAEFMEKNGRRPTDNEVAVLVRETRMDKLTEISQEEVQSRQRERLEPHEAQSLSELRTHAQEAVPTHSLDSPVPSLNYAQEHLFERISVAEEHDLLTEALRHGRGRLDLGSLVGALHLEEASGAVLRSGTELATRASLERERAMVSIINRGLGRFERLGGSEEFLASDRLRPEQKNAVAFVLDSHDRAVNLRGAAGTGKTATLQELKRGLEEGGREIVAIAPTMSAVEELKSVGFAKATTIARVLADPAMAGTLQHKVLIVDEAGMVSGRQMSELLSLAERHGTRLVFSGDTKQIQSVEASDALRVLERESQLKSVSLTQVQRQSAPDYRQAVEELRRNPERGFAALESIGAVREVPFLDRAPAVALAYREALATPNAQGNARSVLVVAPTHEEIARVTSAIREDRRQHGELGAGVTLDRHVPLNYTAAQKSDPRNFHPGQLLVFHRAVKDVQKNEILEVVRAGRGHLVARDAHGTERELGAKQARAFEVFERRSMEVAEHDKLLLGANRRETGFRATNGELVTVARVTDSGRIELEDGRILPADYRQIDHGYAVTAHRSQGKSVDTVVISADSMKRELFYVAASRGRESLAIVTSDAEQLRESIARSGARQSASELARNADIELPENLREGLHRGVTRGLDAARHLAHHHAQHLPYREAAETIQAPALEQLKPELPQLEIARGFGHGIGR
jgi:conjugative relaxase-like TrwC/TraI family protein